MNPVNNVRYNNGILEDLCFNKDNISVGISSDYMVPDQYAESCFTGWYKSKSTATPAPNKDNYTLISNKPPGGSVQLTGTTKININDNLGYTTLGCNDFTLETWVYIPSNQSNTFTVPIITDGNISLTSEGYRIEVTYNSGPNDINFNVYLGSAGIPWDILDTSSESPTYYNTNTWHHICLSRKGDDIKFGVNGSWLFTTTSNLCIANATDTISIGAFKTGNVNKENKGFYFTNLRFLFGLVKYDLTSPSFTVPTYPISAIGNTGSTITVPLLFNAFQNTRKLFNQGQRSFTITETGTIPWSSNTPFLYDIPRLYRWSQTGGTQNFINNINSIARTIDNSGPYATYQAATDWYRSKNNIFINNFDYSDIPTSGLTYYYDPEHIMSFPLNTYVGAYTGSSVYNLINNLSSTWEIISANNYKHPGELITGTNYFNINGVTLTEAFTVVSIFKSETNFFNYKSLLPGTTGNTSTNGVKIRAYSGGTKGLDFIVCRSTGTEDTILTNYTGYTLTGYTMFTVTGSGNISKQFKVYKDDTLVSSVSTLTNRLSGSSVNMYWGITDGGSTIDSVTFRLFAIYNRELSSDEVSRLYSNIAFRL